MGKIYILGTPTSDTRMVGTYYDILGGGFTDNHDLIQFLMCSIVCDHLLVPGGCYLTLRTANITLDMDYLSDTLLNRCYTWVLLKIFCHQPPFLQFPSRNGLRLGWIPNTVTLWSDSSIGYNFCYLYRPPFKVIYTDTEI